ncbi:MAG: DUF4159 domain-containing protein [Aestuariivirga sp.]|uniref:DUF4159 domain-containing protein n=1 Tax=Aestuariivirga sp. TaxID=2650926 RepID=UPI0038D1BAB2
MNLLSALTFATPLALAALLLLPVIWWLLRFTPPKPAVVNFPPVRLLLELVNREEQPDKTPWWLMLLRLALAALVIIGVSQPFYAPDRAGAPARDPLLLVVDDGWAAARDWDTRQRIMSEILDAAAVAGAPVTLASTTPTLRPQALEPQAAADVRARAAALAPRAMDPDRAALLTRLQQAFGGGAALQVVWLSDGIDSGEATDFAKGLLGLAGGRARVEAIMPEAASLPVALASPGFNGGRIKVTALRVAGGPEQTIEAIARAGNGRSLGEAQLRFTAGASKAEAAIELPVELRNEVGRIALEGQNHAAASFLMDDRWRRKTVGLMSGAAAEASQPLLSPLYYVSRALEPYVELSAPTDAAALKNLLDQGLSMLVLADIGVLPPEEQEMVSKWVDNGGLLLRFAGPRLAGAQDSLIPVRLREGGRALGSALSWETPQPLQAFPEASPFAGLGAEPGVTVNRQVLAEPDSELPDRVWASLADGTPLVTAAKQGKGMIVLFHVTANADWSNLPISGLFVEMLRRVLDIAPAAGGGMRGGPASADAQAFAPYRELNGAGDLTDPSPDIQPIPAAAIDKASVSAATPAGLYRRGEQERAINITRSGDRLTAIAGLPDAIAIRSLSPRPALALAPYAFALAMLLFLADCLAALVMSGGLKRLRQRGGTAPAALALLFLAAWQAMPAQAQGNDTFAMHNALETRLAYVITGDAEIDRISEEGLKGLGEMLRDRTSVEAGAPTGINIERDELVFFPLIYWPVKPDATVPSDAALARMDAYMKGGGTILFDLREDGAGSDALSGGATASSEALRRILAKLDVPPLEPVPPAHVLTKSFYLLDRFPGRYDSGKLWVETADSAGANAGATDGVSGIIIGSNDYAAAWAMDDMGEPLYAAIPGSDRQREFAFRTGINIVMYALTGNYKADQVHVPALLERLGQ